MIRRRRLSTALATAVAIAPLLGSAMQEAASAPVQAAPRSGLASPAAAVAPTAASVTVPRRTSDRTELELRGASVTGLAVGQATGRLLLGSSGELTRHGTVGERAVHSDMTGRVNSVVGGTFAWSEPNATETEFVLHRVNLATGVDSPVTMSVPPRAFTGDGWLTFTGDRLVRTLAAGGSTTLVSGITSMGAVAADRDGALATYTVTVDGAQQHRLALITFAVSSDPMTVEQLAIGSASAGRPSVHRVALSGQTIAWVTPSPNDSRSDVHHRARAGGAVTRVRADGLGAFSYFAAADGRVGWLKGNGLTVLEGAVQRRVKALGVQQGLYAVGDALLTAIGGKIEIAGVYRIRGAGAVRIASVPPVPTEFRSVALSGNRVYYADDARTAPSFSSVWYRRISASATAGGAPTLSPPTLLPRRAGRVMGISFSAGRGTIGRPSTGGPIFGEVSADGTLFLDRGAVVRATDHRPPSSGVAKASGPYVLIQSSLFHVDGRNLLDAGDFTTGPDLFGPLFAYGRPDGSVWVFDAQRATSSVNPRRVADACPGDCGTLAAVWGDTVAWTGEDGDITIRTLSTSATRVVPSAGPVERLRMSEGVLHWATFGENNTLDHHLLDLQSPTSVAVALDGLADPVVDGRYVAGFRGAERDLVVQPLPFGGTYAPRLLGTVAAASFNPGGSGAASRWTPAFDATKPLREVRLRIYHGGTMIRTLIGSAVDGSIRDLAWDGRTGAGRLVPPGTYVWRLTAMARDGEGALHAADGRGAVSGTVVVR